jgi:hypothetical protein
VAWSVQRAASECDHLRTPDTTKRKPPNPTALGLGHYVTTHGVVHPRGHIDAQTRTRSVSWFCGYHSGVCLLFADATGSTIGSSTLQVFGVDGAWLGRGDRTDYWGEEIDPDVTLRARTLAVVHTGAPQVLQRTVERAIAGLWPIADVVAEVNRTIGHAWSTRIAELASVKAGGSQ